MNGEKIVSYLSDLTVNNNREWYHKNKSRYKEANQEFEALLSELIAKICNMDCNIPYMEPKGLTFKLVRDTRFSHDKSPYNPAFRAHIAPKGKLPIPVGYFIMIQPGGRSFLGGGLFADMFREATVMVRDYISSHGKEWDEIITNPSFLEYFTVGGTALKKVPLPYSTSHPQAEYLKYKSWFLEYPISDKQIIQGDFADISMDVFARMKDFNHFLNKALAGFQMPER